MPAFVSTLCICIVFVPMFFLTRRRRGTCSCRWRGGRVRDAGVVPPVAHAGADDGEVPAAGARARRAGHAQPQPQSVRALAARASSAASSACATAIAACCERCLRPPRAVRRRCSSLVCVASLGCCCRCSARTSFPTVDAGQFKLHVRGADRHAHRGDGARCAIASRATIRERDSRRASSAASSTTSACRTAASTCRTATRRRSAPADAEILIALNEDHRPTDGLRARAARASCRSDFPASTFFFLPADIVSQILNFGLPAPIDVQVVGRNLDGEPRSSPRRCSPKLAQRARASSTCTCSRPFDQPTLHVDVDRTRAQQVGLHAARRREQPAGLAVSGSGQTAPSFWLESEERRAATSSRCRRRSTAIDSLAGPGEHPDHRRPSGARRSSSANLAHDHARTRRTAIVIALQRAAGDRHLRQRAGPRPRQRRARRSSTIVDGSAQGPAARARSSIVRGQVETHAVVVQRAAASAWCSRSCWSTC